MGWPQAILLGLWLIGMGIIVAKHGQPKEGRHNAIAHAVALALWSAILWWGGFFG